MMWHNIGLEQCLSFIECQLRQHGHSSSTLRPAITISRMTGSGGRTVASKLAEYLQAHAPAESPWTIFDKNLMEKVLEEHHLPKRLEGYLAETHKPIFGDMLEELLGLHPSSWTLAQQTAETILHLAKLGCVILIGRGANIVTGELKNAYHVRLIGSLEKRIERVKDVYHLDPPVALDFIHKEDKGRRRYIKETFGKEIDDPQLYHLVINTDRITSDDAARLIGEEVIHRFHLEHQRIAA